MANSNDEKITVLHLNGNSVTQSYVACGTNPVLNFSGTEPYTLTAKMKMDGLGGTIMGKLIGSSWSGGMGNANGYSILPYPGEPGGIRAYRYVNPYDCDAKIPDIYHKWFHLIVTFKDGVYTIFVNGKQVATTGGFGPINPTPANAEFLIGSCYRGAVGTIGNSPENWYYESVSVISEPVEENEIHKLSGKHEYPLVALWDFTSKTAKDLTGNGNDGRLVGTAEFVQVDPIDWKKIEGL